MPIGASEPVVRYASTAAPCERRRWCATRSSAIGSVRPGAMLPIRWPTAATTHGSLWVIHQATLSPSASYMIDAYSDEALHDVAVLPATTILKRLGKVPVIERRGRLHALLEKALAEAPIEVDALLVRGAHPGGLDPGPGDAEAIRVEAVGSDEVDVLGPAVIVVAGDIPGVAVCDVAGRVTEGVPDGWAAAILVDGALDLVAGGGGSPGEVRRKRHRTPLVCRWLSVDPRLAKLQGS